MKANYRIQNLGSKPVHVLTIEGDRDFSLTATGTDFFDPITIAAGDVDPEPVEGYFMADEEFSNLMGKRPTQLWARDAIGKKWHVPSEL